MSFAPAQQQYPSYQPKPLPQSTWGNSSDLSIGGSNPQANMSYAAEGMPGASYYQQRQLAGYYGAPMKSTNGIQDFGRWNWAQSMPKPQAQNPYQPSNPNPANPSVPSNPSVPQAPQAPGAPDPWVSQQTPPVMGAPTVADKGVKYIPGVSPANYDPSQDLGLAAIRNGFKDSAGGVGSQDWWGAVRNDVQTSDPGATIPWWMKGQ